MELLKDSIDLTKRINDEVTSEDEKVEIRALIIDKIDKIDSILAEFIKLFSVVKNVDLKNMYDHLFMKFNGVEIQIKLFFIRHDIEYAKNSIRICEYLCKIFKILEQHAEKERKEKSVAN